MWHDMSDPRGSFHETNEALGECGMTTNPNGTRIISRHETTDLAVPRGDDC